MLVSVLYQQFWMGKQLQVRPQDCSTQMGCTSLPALIKQSKKTIYLLWGVARFCSQLISQSSSHKARGAVTACWMILQIPPCLCSSVVLVGLFLLNCSIIIFNCLYLSWRNPSKSGLFALQLFPQEVFHLQHLLIFSLCGSCPFTFSHLFVYGIPSAITKGLTELLFLLRWER